jgi:uncharacterized protein (DUF2345 family)
MDVYCEDSISFRTKQDFNFYADRDINFEAGNNINIKAAKEMQIETGANYHVKVGANGLLTLSGNYDTNAGGHIWETSGGSNETRAGPSIIETAGVIHMNGPAAATADKVKELKTHALPDLPKQDGSITESVRIMRRMPTPEPYPQHENLDPEKYKPAKTNRDVDGRNTSKSSSMKEPGSYWKKYSTSTDTFAKVGK